MPTDGLNFDVPLSPEDAEDAANRQNEYALDFSGALMQQQPGAPKDTPAQQPVQQSTQQPSKPPEADYSKTEDILKPKQYVRSNGKFYLVDKQNGQLTYRRVLSVPEGASITDMEDVSKTGVGTVIDELTRSEDIAVDKIEAAKEGLEGKLTETEKDITGLEEQLAEGVGVTTISEEEMPELQEAMQIEDAKFDTYAPEKQKEFLDFASALVSGDIQSAAQLQLKQGSERALAGQMAIIASQRGYNPAAMRQAQTQAAELQQQAALEAAMLRSQEQIEATKLGAGIAESMRAAEISEKQVQANIDIANQATQVKENITKFTADTNRLFENMRAKNAGSLAEFHGIIQQLGYSKEEKLAILTEIVGLDKVTAHQELDWFNSQVNKSTQDFNQTFTLENTIVEKGMQEWIALEEFDLKRLELELQKMGINLTERQLKAQEEQFRLSYEQKNMEMAIGAVTGIASAAIKTNPYGLLASTAVDVATSAASGGG